MVILKSKQDLAVMKIAGRISAEALAVGGKAVAPGVTTREINRKIHDFILAQGATPSFLGLYGFPADACISVNEEVIHGLPGDRVLLEGDVVSIDVGAIYQGFHGDNAATFAVGKIEPAIAKFLAVVKQSLLEGVEAAVVGNRVGDISHAVETLNRANGYGLVREYTGHGVGRALHEDPSVPNVGKPGRGPRLVSGMTFAIEPMVNMGGDEITEVDRGGWTVTLTKDHSISGHFEHTIAVTDNGPIILTPTLYE